MAVKYHVKTSHPDNLIALHNFKGGYCGISNVENGTTNVCYLVRRDIVKEAGGLKYFEDQFLKQNPLLRYIFDNSDFLFDKPLTINEISFATKGPIEDHILMAGDSAGMITPLCGNGMAMAMHSGKLLSECIAQHIRTINHTRRAMELTYISVWKKNFSRRLWLGRQMQKLFGNHLSSTFAVNLALHIRPIASALVRNSHGTPF